MYMYVEDISSPSLQYLITKCYGTLGKTTIKKATTKIVKQQKYIFEIEN